MDGWMYVCMEAWAYGMYVCNACSACSACMCVCVDHLHRCKTSFCLVDGLVLYLLDFELCLQGGTEGHIGAVPNEATLWCP